MSYNQLPLDLNGNVQDSIKTVTGVVDTNNSTTTPLTANSVYTGTATATLNYSQINIFSYSDQASANNGLVIQFSQDGTHWDHQHIYSASAAAGEVVNVPTHGGLYYRVVYTNGSVNQTAFRLQSTLKAISAVGTVLEVDDTVTAQDDAVLTKAILVGQTTGIGAQYVNVNASPNGSIKVSMDDGTQDTFGQLITGGRTNQIETSFIGSALPTNITTATSNGGTVIVSGGAGSFTTGTNGNATVTGTTIATTIYHGGHEIYAMWTASFTTPTSAASYQRIGLYDSNNGFRIGYEGTIGTLAVIPTFGVTIRNNGVDTFIPRTSFNGDLLTGLVTSKFTRAGTPEAINLTFHNVFRVRLGWLGSAPITFEVLTPDGSWLPFHTVLQPNSSALPSVSNPNLPVKVEVVKTNSDATSLTLSTSCWTAGTTSGQTVPTYDQSTSSLAIGATYTTSPFDTSLNGNFLSYYLLSTTPGMIYLDISSDTVTWTTIFSDNNVAGLPYTYSNTLQARYSRFRFVNGYMPNAGGQSNFYQVVTQSASGTDSTMAICNPYGTDVNITPYNTMKVSNEPSGLLYDDFDTFDTVTRWNAAVLTGGATVAPASSALAFTLGTTSGNSAIVSSQASFLPTGGNYLDTVFLVQLEATFATNCRRYWGRGSVTGLNPNNFVGFEVTAAGVLQAVVYTGGSLSFSSTVMTIPTDGLYHTYKMQIRADTMYFFYDSEDAPFYTLTSHTALPGTEPLLMVGDNTALAAHTPTFNIMACWVSDTSSIGSQICDGTNPYIKAAVVSKNSQGTYAVQVQRINDSGRNETTYFTTVPVLTTATDTLQSLTGYKSGAAVGATTTPAVVTTGKTYRIQSITLTAIATGTVGYSKVTLRANTGGVVAITSPAVNSWIAGPGTGGGGATGTATSTVILFPEGLEFAAGTGIGVSVIGYNTTGTATASLNYIDVAIDGYEY